MKDQNEELMQILKVRFEKNMYRHEGLKWTVIQEKLKSYPQKLWSLNKMESTGGEPDVAGFDKQAGEFIFYDCSRESPMGRRSVCYDRKGQQERVKKGIHPKGNAVDMAMEMGIDLLTEEQYRKLQELGNFDMKTSSWLITPTEIRNLGGAIFADRRYDQVFVYHNSAPTFYASRGFRGLLRI